MIGDTDRLVAARVNGHLVDLSSPLTSDGVVEPVTFDDEEGRSIYWHSSSHIMAQAVKRLFPEARLTIGPPVEDGFYYDFDLQEPLSEHDLSKIEEVMREIVATDFPFSRHDVSREEAVALFRQLKEDYKVEILHEIEDGEGISVYRQGEFVDLCRGPHIPSTGTVKAFKLLSVAGAYWRGDERNRMLQRIYGVSFPTQEELDDHLQRLEEAKRRDHRMLGRELDLFSISHDQVGPGLILWHPKGGRIRTRIENFWRDAHYDAGYDIVYSPHIGRSRLWETSGHLSFYRDNMYSPMEVEGQEYYIKPMNCPFHIMIYKSQLRSYRDLPFRWAELGTVYRYERSGVLHGLPRVRGFTQDDAHIFCRPDQIGEEILGVLDFTLFMLRSFGFQEFEAYLATRPEKAVGALDRWERATDSLRRAIDVRDLPYKIDEGGGAFYGPKIDLKVKDAIGRLWQLTTIQFDFNLPERFDLTFIGEDGKEHRPYMVHRALLGSMERFFGILIEHYAGAFPVWLAPVQVALLPLTDNQAEYAEEVANRLKEKGITVEVERGSGRLGQKIRAAEVKKIPYMLVVGKHEVECGTVAVRRHGVGDIGSMPYEDFEEQILGEFRITSFGGDR
jgi:threonyl-tRNA synthetase